MQKAQIEQLTDAEKTEYILALQAQVQAYQSAHEELKYFKQIVDRVQDIVIISDASGHGIYVNQAIAKMGYTREEYLGQYLPDFIHPDDSSSVAAVIGSRRHQLQPIAIAKQHRMRHSNGHYVWGESVSYPMLDDSGEFFGILTVTRRLNYMDHVHRFLRDSENRLRLIAEYIDDAVYFYDKNEQVEYVSAGFEKITGYTPDDLYRENFIPYAHEDDLQQVIERWQKLFKGHGFDKMEYRIITKQGETRWVLSQWRPIMDENGDLLGVVGRDTDITHIKAYDAAVATKDAKLRAVLDSNADAIWTMDRDYRVLDLNQAMHRAFSDIHGTTLEPGDFIQQKSYSTPPEIQRKWRSFYERAFDGENVRAEITESGSSGFIHYDVAAAPIYEPDGSINSIVVSARDVTHYVETQQALRQSEEAYRTLVANFPNGLVAKFKPDLTFTIAGGKGLTQLGFSPVEVQGKRLRDIVSADMANQFEPKMAATLRGEKSITELQQDARIFRVYLMPIIEDTDITGGIIITQDVTAHAEARRREVELLVERERIKLIHSFIIDASHEFRTPLANINTAAHMLVNVDDPQKRTKYYTRITQHTDSIKQLLDTLLHVIRVENGIDLQRDTVQLNALIDYMLTDMDQHITQKGLSLNLKLTEDLPTLPGDSQFLSAALKAVLDNALRFTNAGGTITIETSTTTNDVIVSISDTGQGIEAAKLTHIFEHFYRGDPARTERGFGMGLALARSIVEQHSGYIDVVSEVGVGSKFRIVLPKAGKGLPQRPKNAD